MESDAVELNERQLKQAVNQSFMEAASRAVEVDLHQDWIESPRIVAIVRSADNKHSALFLCVGSQISKGVYLDLSTSELIALDDVFRCERGTFVLLLPEAFLLFDCIVRRIWHG
ncbi:hypothetical protein FBUS_04354 [Fasciolopsis buskii]|uniref:Uncharacterized protein n=1 Tax=Fasciolopsis buskii TaxID=27845 RepID=A0A8E0VPE6_9TREM|nr:hypothetical protein FBUS_04354 [Fasciolopsis buski]